MNADQRRSIGSGTGAFRIRPAGAADLPDLRRIERAAAELLRAYDVPDTVLHENTAIEDFEEAIRAGSLWVAAAADDAPVGFAHVEILDGHAHLEEIDVDPRHGGRGIGAALVHAVCEWVADRKLRGVTLTTYRDVPFNAPFYRRLGFVDLDDRELSAALRELVQEEARRGLDPARRTVMRWTCHDKRSEGE